MTEIRACSPEFHESVQAAVARARELRAAGAAIRQRLSATQKGLRDELDRARATQAAACEQLANLRAAECKTAQPKPPDVVLQALTMLGKDEGDLDEMTHDLIAAHQAAVAIGDDDMRRELARALMLIGRHLAAKIGPSAAGVVLH